MLSPEGFALVCIGHGVNNATIEAVVERASAGAFVASVAGKTEEEEATAVTVFRIERS